MHESSCLVQILGLVGQIQSIFFMRVVNFPYMKKTKFFNVFGLLRTNKSLQSFTKLTF